jgi:Ca2+-binding EF-hand superfamily protein
MGIAGGDNEVTEVIVSEALEALDLDSDGRISKEEFVHVHTQR